jgi:hypothetical protein
MSNNMELRGYVPSLRMRSLNRPISAFPKRHLSVPLQALEFYESWDDYRDVPISNDSGTVLAATSWSARRHREVHQPVVLRGMARYGL